MSNQRSLLNMTQASVFSQKLNDLTNLTLGSRTYSTQNQTFRVRDKEDVLAYQQQQIQQCKLISRLNFTYF
jgi:hypothetical protein